jgi:hypothetical protein
LIDFLFLVERKLLEVLEDVSQLDEELNDGRTKREEDQKRNDGPNYKVVSSCVFHFIQKIWD